MVCHVFTISNFRNFILISFPIPHLLFLLLSDRTFTSLDNY